MSIISVFKKAPLEIILTLLIFYVFIFMLIELKQETKKEPWHKTMTNIAVAVSILAAATSFTLTLMKM